MHRWARSTVTPTLVTGGGSGIGLGCAQALAADGADVTICGRTEARLVEGADRDLEQSRRRAAAVGRVDRRRRHRRGPGGGRDRAGGRARRREAPRARQLRRRLAAHGSAAPGRRRRGAGHARAQRDGHVPHDQARGAAHGGRGRRLVRRHLVARRSRHLPLPRRVRRREGRDGLPRAGRGRRAGPVADPGELGAAGRDRRPRSWRAITAGGPVLDSYHAQTPLWRVGTVEDVVRTRPLPRRPRVGVDQRPDVQRRRRPVGARRAPTTRRSPDAAYGCRPALAAPRGATPPRRTRPDGDRRHGRRRHRRRERDRTGDRAGARPAWCRRGRRRHPRPAHGGGAQGDRGARAPVP